MMIIINFVIIAMLAPIPQSLEMKREYPATPLESFETANEGLYYVAFWQDREARVASERFITRKLTGIYCLGFGAFWQHFHMVLSNCRQEIHLLEYIEDSGKPFTHYLKLIKDKPYTYGKHFAPHDINVHEYIHSGASRIEVAREHGVSFTQAPKLSIIKVLTPLEIC